jgi:predicted dehydrogenase
MNHALRIGIIGCGRVMAGPYMALIDRMRFTGEVTVEIVCDVVTEKAKQAAHRFGIPRWTTNHTEVIEADNVDIVMILSSMNEHAAFTMEALDAGKHVLVEKPMGVNLDQARQVLEKAKSSVGLLVVAPHIILSPTYRAVWRHVHAGDIGKVYLARARYGWSGPDWGEWFYRPGGGALFDLGVYNVTALTGLLGPVRRVSAMVGTAIQERTVNGKTMKVEADDNAQVLLDFGDSVFAVVTTGFTIQKYRSPAVELYGGAGTLQILGDDWDPDGYELWENRIGAWKTYIETDPAWPWTEGIRHLVQCIRTGTRPLNTPEHAFHALEIMLKAQESGRTGSSLTVDSTFVPPEFDDIDPAEAAHKMHDRSYTS